MITFFNLTIGSISLFPQYYNMKQQKLFSALIILKMFIKHEISILVGLNSFKYINVENFQNVYNI